MLKYRIKQIGQFIPNWSSSIYVGVDFTNEEQTIRIDPWMNSMKMISVQFYVSTYYLNLQTNEWYTEDFHRSYSHHQFEKFKVLWNAEMYLIILSALYRVANLWNEQIQTLDISEALLSPEHPIREIAEAYIRHSQNVNLAKRD